MKAEWRPRANFDSFVEKIINVPNDRSTFYTTIGNALTPRPYVHGIGARQSTHGGLEFGSMSGRSVLPSGPASDLYRRFRAGLSNPVMHFELVRSRSNRPAARC
jgi:hypothetical protein